MDFAVPVGHKVKLKESEKNDKYLNLARESKKLRNMKVTFIQIVIGVFGTTTKGLIQGLEDLEIRGSVDTIQTTTLLRILRPEETCCHSNSCERSSELADAKNS